ncbi:MAG: YidB family protein [Gammaproteobacteria bacterium]
MGLLDGLVGGVIGGEMASLVSGFIERHGGVQGIVSQLQEHGLGETAKSWIGTGSNLPISGAQVHQVFGGSSGGLADLAARTGLDPLTLAQQLSHVLPQAIDKLTPAGVIPKN